MFHHFYGRSHILNHAGIIPWVTKGAGEVKKHLGWGWTWFGVAFLISPLEGPMKIQYIQCDFISSRLTLLAHSLVQHFISFPKLQSFFPKIKGSRTFEWKWLNCCRCKIYCTLWHVDVIWLSLNKTLLTWGKVCLSYVFDIISSLFMWTHDKVSHLSCYACF